MTGRLKKLAEEAATKFTDARKASQWLRKRVKDDATLQTELVTLGVAQWADHVVNVARHGGRSQAKAAANRWAGDAESVIRPGNVIAVAILETWLVGDRRLGDCDAAYLALHADRERTLASGHARNAAFYDRLRAALKGSQKVREAFTASKAAAAWRAVEQGAAKVG